MKDQVTFLIKSLVIVLFLGGADFSQAESPCDNRVPHPSLPEQIYVNSEAKASALVVHGLNNSFQMMGDMVNALQELGLNTYSVSLSGHKGLYNEFESATKEDWLADVHSAYCELRGLGVPILFVGYSLGGLLGPYLKTQKEGVDFKAFVFLAPAMAIHRPLEWLSWLRIFGGGYSLPARAPKDYRIYSKVPASAYWELLDAKETFTEALTGESLEKLRVPALILVDPDDELVSAKGLRQIMTANGLSEFWNFIEVRSNHTYKHIIIDRKTLPEHDWNHLKSFVLSLI